MTLRHMRIFLEVCRQDCNTTRAAEALHMTQPAVSLAIRELEEHYGVVLFDRLRRRLYLTETGRHFAAYAGSISTLFEDMERQLSTRDGGSLLRVGASVTIGSQFLPSYVKAFCARYPGTEIRALVEPTELLEPKLLKNDLDLALIEGVPRDPALVTEDYMEDRLVVIAPADGPYHSGQTLSLEEFRQARFLLRERGSGTREEFERVAEQAGLAVTPTWEASSTTALVNAVIAGLGIAVLPYRMVLGPLEREMVRAVRVEGLDFRRKFRIVYHKDKHLGPTAARFLELCRNYELDYPIPPYNGLY